MRENYLFAQYFNFIISYYLSRCIAVDSHARKQDKGREEKRERYNFLVGNRAPLFFVVFFDESRTGVLLSGRGDKKRNVAICFGTAVLIAGTLRMIIHYSCELSMVVGPADSLVIYGVW